MFLELLAPVDAATDDDWEAADEVPASGKGRNLVWKGALAVPRGVKPSGLGALPSGKFTAYAGFHVSAPPSTAGEAARTPRVFFFAASYSAMSLARMPAWITQVCGVLLRLHFPQLHRPGYGGGGGAQGFPNTFRPVA